MQNSRQYHLVAQAIQWLAEHQSNQPDLSELARAVNVSPHHLQRTFQAWAGVSPKQFLKSLTRRAALTRLAAGASVLDTAMDVGLSGPGRLHDLLVTTDALTPGQARQRGAGVCLEYGYGSTPFGQALVAWNERGLAFLAFCDEVGPTQALAELRGQWGNASFVERPRHAQHWLERIFAGDPDQPLSVWLRGSPFQLQVWQALLKIPEAAHATYGRVACDIGRPGASRAVGGAIGANPVAWLIPCHRVIRQAGDLGGYRWGTFTKRALIGFEAARQAQSMRGADAREVKEQA
jgi:AraC family transcriptional regulator of adaptative response/methylated-DNA-[protein]-cysteine methyltransferase